MSTVPPPTPESILRNIQQQVLLVMELQDRRDVVSAPRTWMQGWLDMLDEAIRLRQLEER